MKEQPVSEQLTWGRFAVMPLRLILLAVSLCTGILLAAELSIASVPAAAEPTELATLHPIRDNTLYYHPQGTRSNGLGEHIFVGHTNHGHERRAVIAFDVAGAIPENATIVSTTLSLNLSRTHSGPQSLTLHQMTADWGEGTSRATENVGRGAQATRGDATWIQPFFGRDRPWKTPGGDFAEGASATTTVAGLGLYTWGPTPNMTSDVQSWLDAPETSFGWLLLGNESEPRTTKRFDSRDHSEASVRPMLIVAYAPAATGQVFIYLPFTVRK